ncbi:MAG: globin [Gemmatimonadota bacterium]|nr:globin [Gemmatimonadota bacterium]MDH4348912.1 globin [Gemmatimonadota bacterium]MDH5283913.1 globin [Gemmatimonadota bacterium]
MAGLAPTPGQVDLAQASYERCRLSDAFMTDFYEAFLASDPRIPPLFAKTDFDRQKRLLQHALGLLMSFARRPNPNLLERIAARHGPADLNIPPELYPLFVGAVLVTVRKHDPQFSDETREAWEAALAPGVSYMERFGR